MSRILLKDLLETYRNRKLDSVERYETILRELEDTDTEDRIRLLAECEDRVFDRENGAAHALELLLSFTAGAYVTGSVPDPEQLILLALLILLLTLIILSRIYASRYFYLKTILENYRDSPAEEFSQCPEYKIVLETEKFKKIKNTLDK